MLKYVISSVIVLLIGISVSYYYQQVCHTSFWANHENIRIKTMIIIMWLMNENGFLTFEEQNFFYKMQKWL